MNDAGPRAHTREHHLESWAKFQEYAAVFADPNRKPWDEVWFRGQRDARWGLHTTLERRSPDKRAVADYLNVIREIKPAIETFTGNQFSMPTEDIEGVCRDYEPTRLEWLLRECATYMAHLRHAGFPSPLLDWTHSPYVAAYFAFYHADPEDDVAIYAYRERPQNFKIGGSDTASIVSFGPNIKTHKRHFRQQSRYTVCTQFDNQWFFVPHDRVFGQKDLLNQDLLWKITIPANERVEVLRFFDKVNLNEFTLFDTEEGLLEMLAMRVLDLRLQKPIRLSQTAFHRTG